MRPLNVLPRSGTTQLGHHLRISLLPHPEFDIFPVIVSSSIAATITPRGRGQGEGKGRRHRREKQQPRLMTDD